MTTHISKSLTANGVRMGEIEDVVAGVVRVACDESVFGRAIGCAGKEKVAGDRNFDLRDDWEGADGGVEVLRSVREGEWAGLEKIGLPAGRVRRDAS